MAVESVNEIFEKHIPARLEKKPELVDQINAKYKFEVTGDAGGTWVVDLTEAGGKVMPGDAEANCNITITTEDFLDIINGKLNGQMAFMTGKLKVAGDMALAMKLGSLLG